VAATTRVITNLFNPAHAGIGCPANAEGYCARGFSPARDVIYDGDKIPLAGGIIKIDGSVRLGVNIEFDRFADASRRRSGNGSRASRGDLTTIGLGQILSW